MNKKYIVFFGAVGFILVVFLIVTLIQQSAKSSTTAQNQLSPVPTEKQEQSSTTFQPPHVTQFMQPTASISQTVTPMNGLSAEQTLQQFYSTFIGGHNPLANGGYKNNPYITDDFKKLIGKLYQDGNKSILCRSNPPANVTIGQETQLYRKDGYITELFISETIPGGKNLYVAELKKINSNWLITDFNCF